MKVHRSLQTNFTAKPKAIEESKQNQQPKAKNCSSQGLNTLANYNVAGVNFKGYYGDQQPAKKLFWILTGRNQIYRDNETDYNTYYTGTNKKWVTTNPEDLLKRTPEQAIQSICTLNNYIDIPGFVLSPVYGPKWG